LGYVSVAVFCTIEFIISQIYMDLLHFTHAAPDPLNSLSTFNASLLPFADGEGNTHLSCLYLEKGGKIDAPSPTYACLMLCVYDCITVTTQLPRTQIDLHAGMGAAVERNEAYSLKSEEGAIVLIVESKALRAEARAISTPQRTARAALPAGGVNA
jgi:hypothetical protein